MTQSSDPGAAGTEYGFYGRLKEEFPSQVIIDLTEVCNLACIHCPHPQFKQSQYYSAKYLEPELNEKAIAEVRQWGQGATQYVRYTGEGEPLIHPRGYEMIQHAVDRSGVFVTLTTNGTIMNEKRTKRLLESGVHMIDISIDAFTPQTYAKIRVNGDLEVTRGNVLNLIDWVGRTGAKTKVVVSYVEQPQNRHETDDFERFWKEHGASYVVVRRLHSAAGAVADIAGLMRKQNATVKRRPCVYPWERVVLNPRGHIAFCPADWTHGSTVTDYRETTIKDTWQGEFYRKLRAAHQRDDYAKHAFCGQCPDWRETRWPSEGRAYADLIQELSED